MNRAASRHAARAAPAAIVLALAALGCAKSAPPDVGTSTAPGPSGAAGVVPVDHLAPDELVEGTQKAFGVPLPRGLEVQESFPDVVHASGEMSVHALVTYFRARLQGGSVREGERSATFEHVTAAGAPPDTELMVHVAVAPGHTLVDVAATPIRHVTPAPDEASRWRAVGLTPQGKVLDKTHLE
ncbi:MAG TPA: hypothetical protein VGG39_15195 [Polyangiaceae bacterium]